MSSAADLLTWLDRPGLHSLYRRLNKTAVRSLQQMRLPNEPDDVEWLVRNADLLAERLTKAGHITAGTATTYASRLRSAGKEFLSAGSSIGGTGKPTRSLLAQALARVPLPLSSDEEVAEAAAVIGRWPSLTSEFVPALARAMDRLERERSKGR